MFLPLLPWLAEVSSLTVLRQEFVLVPHGGVLAVGASVWRSLNRGAGGLVYSEVVVWVGKG